MSAKPTGRRFEVGVVEHDAVVLRQLLASARQALQGRGRCAARSPARRSATMVASEMFGGARISALVRNCTSGKARLATSSARSSPRTTRTVRAATLSSSSVSIGKGTTRARSSSSVGSSKASWKGTSILFSPLSPCQLDSSRVPCTSSLAPRTARLEHDLRALPRQTPRDQLGRHREGIAQAEADLVRLQGDEGQVARLALRTDREQVHRHTRGARSLRRRDRVRAGVRALVGDEQHAGEGRSLVGGDRLLEGAAQGGRAEYTSQIQPSDVPMHLRPEFLPARPQQYRSVHPSPAILSAGCRGTRPFPAEKLPRQSRWQRSVRQGLCRHGGWLHRPGRDTGNISGQAQQNVVCRDDKGPGAVNPGPTFPDS